MITLRIYLASTTKLSLKWNNSARSENLTHFSGNSAKKKKSGFVFLLYVVECKRLRVSITAVPGSAVLKQKEEALTQTLLQQIMFVFNTGHFEKSLLMEENQHYLLTQQHISILISDQKLMVPMSSKHTLDVSFTCCVLYVCCVLCLQPLSAPFTS